MRNSIKENQEIIQILKKDHICRKVMPENQM